MRLLPLAVALFVGASLPWACSSPDDGLFGAGGDAGTDSAPSVASSSSAAASSSTGAPFCTPGQQAACACPGQGNVGAQVCDDAGASFGPCVGCAASSVATSSAVASSSGAASASASSSAASTGGHGGAFGAGGGSVASSTAASSTASAGGASTGGGGAGGEGPSDAGLFEDVAADALGQGGLPLGALCGQGNSDASTCGEGLACCYPCKAQMCNPECTLACNPGVHGCAGGCFPMP